MTDDLTLTRQSRLVAALEAAWAKVMERHAELPPVAIIVGQAQATAAADSSSATSPPSAGNTPTPPTAAMSTRS